jgi:ribosomal-protein-serine acetyltransferase
MDPILIDLLEVIETKRLKLQMPKAGLGEKLYGAMLDGYEDYVRYLNWPAEKPTIEDVEKTCREQHAQFILRQNISYIIIEKTSNKVIGKCALPSILAKWDIPQFGISYFISKAMRGNGYATEAARAMAILALERLGAKKVEIYCDAENIASTRIPLKLGFQLECTQKGGWPRPDGKLTELQTYSIFSQKDLQY